MENCNHQYGIKSRSYDNYHNLIEEEIQCNLCHNIETFNIKKGESPKGLLLYGCKTDPRPMIYNPKFY